ncbi:right-handed parallel beta-helix repeat-containing protein [Lysobacter sp. CCNWLW3]|uniref:right-handed parallel beta-helix repeat-containing protein n=1 Tax=unclassified Lysobacter TaxID=2635362 RepID=UPI002FCEDC5E
MRRRGTEHDGRRRALLRAGLTALVGAIAPHAGAVAARGGTRIDVRAHGARGDGRHDDTAAFQSAIDALPASGGTVVVPAGDYRIDPQRSVRLRSRMHLAMEAGTRLLAIPNAAARAYVLSLIGIDGVEVSGGRIVGDRDTHLGTTGEWGHGVMVRGSSSVTLRELHISRCWGDGISIGGDKAAGGRITPSSDVLIANVRCVGNRRQGLTIGRSRRVRVRDSEFADTGGTLPGCGIDIEPDAGDSARDAVISGCLIHGNQGAGVQIYKRSAGIVLRGCTIEANRGHGVLVIGASDCSVVDNRIRRNALGGLSLRPGSNGVVVSLNEFVANGPARAHAGKDGPRARQLSVAPEARAIRIDDDNRYAE